MRYGLLLGLLLFPQTDAVVPKSEHEVHTYQREEKSDITHRTCPQGYEGHFVDSHIGIDTFDEPLMYGYSQPLESYAVCIKKETMDAVRKNPDLKIYRQYPRPI